MDISKLDLSSCELQALHWDERGAGITLVFEMALDTANRALWQASPDHTRVIFYLEFSGVQDVTIAGWSYRLPLSVVIDEGAQVVVTITGTGTSVHFTASAQRVGSYRTFRQGSL